MKSLLLIDIAVYKVLKAWVQTSISMGVDFSTKKMAVGGGDSKTGDYLITGQTSCYFNLQPGDLLYKYIYIYRS